jgi:hypothetical protein
LDDVAKAVAYNSDIHMPFVQPDTSWTNRHVGVRPSSIDLKWRQCNQSISTG